MEGPEWNPDEAIFEITGSEQNGSITKITIDLDIPGYDWQGVSIIYNSDTGQLMMQLPIGSCMPVAPRFFWDGIAYRVREMAIRQAHLELRSKDGTLVNSSLLALVDGMAPFLRDYFRADLSVDTETMLNQIAYRWPDGSAIILIVTRKEAPSAPGKVSSARGSGGAREVAGTDAGDTARSRETAPGAGIPRDAEGVRHASGGGERDTGDPAPFTGRRPRLSEQRSDPHRYPRSDFGRRRGGQGAD